MTLINCGLVETDGDVSNELKCNTTESQCVILKEGFVTIFYSYAGGGG